MRDVIVLCLGMLLGVGLTACVSQSSDPQPVPMQDLPTPTPILLPPISTETPPPTPETATAPASEDVELGPDDYTVIEIKSMDRSDGIVYGQLTLQIPEREQEHFEDLQLLSLSAGRFDRWIGGAYYLVFPKDIVLEHPVKVDLTYTEEALAHYRDLYPGFVESDLAICTYSETFNQYFLFDSEYDPDSNHLSTEIYEFESEQFSLSAMAASSCKAPQRLNLSACEDQAVPEGATFSERQYWINLCHQKRAIQLEDLQICENMQDLVSTQTNVVSEDVCKSKVLVLSESGTVEAFRQLGEQEPREKCLRHFAAGSMDIALCDEISSELTRASCYSDVAVASADLELCLAIDVVIIGENCIAGLAIETLDPALCAMLSEEPSATQADCYSRLAVAMKRPDLCEFVSPPFSESYKAECIASAQ